MNIHEQPHMGNGASAPAWNQDEYDNDIARAAALPEERWGAEIALLVEKYKPFKIGVQLLKRHIKEAHARVAKMERDKTRKAREEAREANAASAAPVAKGSGVRPRILAPYPDGPRAGVMRLLDKMLTTDEAEPPMRDLYWALTEARLMEPGGVHLLTAESANAEGGDSGTRLPAPPVLSLIPHDKHSLGLLIEKCVEFYKVIKTKSGDEVEVTVALPQPFIEAYMAYRDSKLPRVWSIATMPIILPNGEILATDGLDRKRKVLFRIDPGIRELLPRGEITDDDIVKAMNYLTDEWLCDVLTNYAGKCVLISMAESVLQRAQFRERPAFNVKAGKPEGGKTTALTMVSCAATGKPAAAAAWSNDPEERRKAIFALARQNLPMVVFDNIPRGLAISCPHIEKALTTDIISDRVLSTSDYEIAPSSTIVAFTGNGTSVKGDLASRMLECNIVVDSPDPASREFKHPEPIEWTLDHRDEILKALFTILLGNPRIKQAKKDRATAKTRFKAWWSLIGSAIEHAAKLASEAFDDFDDPNEGRARPRAVDFEELIAVSKGEDEEASSLVEGLRALDKFNNGSSAGFPASLVATNWLTSCAGESEPLKSFLGCKPEGSLSAKSVGKRLRAHVDEPVDVGDEVWTLKVKKDLHTNSDEFHIHKRKR
jgi:hypothetical protein